MLPQAPAPRFVVADDGTRLATYAFGDEGDPQCLLVHGFASSAAANWVVTGWTRDLVRAGLRVVAYDQRGHGGSGKPHDPSAFALDRLVADAFAVMDAHRLDEASWVGYSLGARVGWRAAIAAPGRIGRAVLGGIPSGDPLARFDLPAARAFIADGTPIADALTRTYMEMASGMPDNDLSSLVALVEGMRGGPQALPDTTPSQPLLIATGEDDPILPQSRALADAAALARFIPIRGRTHFSAPPSRDFRVAGVRFLSGDIDAADVESAELVR